MSFCEEFDIREFFSTLNHPQANSQMGASNKIIKHTLKAKLDVLKGGLIEELLGVLWSYRTTIRTSTGKTSFSLAFRVEAVILLGIGILSFHTATYDEEENQRKLDLME